MSDDRRTEIEALADEDLEAFAGGQGWGQTTGGSLKAISATIHFDDNEITKKTLFASASGGGNVAGGGGGPAPKSYTFDEVIDGDYVPVTYKLID